MRRVDRDLVVLAILAALGLVRLAAASDPADHRPDGKGMVPRGLVSSNGNHNGKGMIYHGGPIMLGTVNVYYIWYGDWTGNTAPSLLVNFTQNLTASTATPQYYAINTTYDDATGATVSNSVSYVSAATCGPLDTCWLGTALYGDADVLQIVTDRITTGALPADPNGVYFVLTAADVTKLGFCSSYCAWHSAAPVNNTEIKYAFVGDAAVQCPNFCLQQVSTSPNDNPGADGMASVIAHELEEAATDPEYSAWYDRRGFENADKCAWTFGDTSVAANGSLFNITVGGLQYLIQQNWVNQGPGYCAMHL